MDDIEERDSGDTEVLYESEELKAIEEEEEVGEEHYGDNLPIISLRNIVVYPAMWIPLTMGQPRSLRIIKDNMPTQRHVVLATGKTEEDEPEPDQIYDVGTVAAIHKVMRAPDGVLRVLVKALDRCRIVKYTQTEPYLQADIERAPEVTDEDPEKEKAMVRLIRTKFRDYVEFDRQTPNEIADIALNTKSTLQLIYVIAGTLPLDIEQGQQLLSVDSVIQKLQHLLNMLEREVEILELGRQIKSQAQGEMEKTQKEFYLREQIKAINRELGNDDDHQIDIKELEESIVNAQMSEVATKEANRELERLRRIPVQAAEYSVIKSYIETLVGLPWAVVSPDSLDLRRARKILNEDHYGLFDIKNRILEYLAVRKLRQVRQFDKEGGDNLWDKVRREREGVVLCFVGPPGVGKTSLGISIARAVDRKFVRLALGGIRDEAEIRGFRRTYVGAMPGRIIQNLRRCGTRNPVFMLDEVDKLGSDFRGDPSSALLEVLDPEQNREFNDHYLDVPFDLSNVMFITTANMVEAIPGPMRDRMEVIQLSSYTEEEKLNIAKSYLVPRQIRENGLLPEEVSFTPGAIRSIIRDHTSEAGVRELERMIAKLCRQSAAQIASNSNSQPLTRIRKSLVPKFLGQPKYHSEQLSQRTDIPGVATGLAWTMTGGDVLFIESIAMPGDAGFTITGQLGDVMKESGQAAFSYIRSHAHEMGIDRDIFAKNSIHVHIPAGAIPKDGPSAGITIATSLASMLTRRAVKKHVGMTGEITLRGKVLPVGGIKEKILAADRLGLTTIIMPRNNKADLDEIPSAIRRRMSFKLVDTVDEVLDLGLDPELEMDQWPNHIKRLGKDVPDPKTPAVEIGIRESILESPSQEQ